MKEYIHYLTTVHDSPIFENVPQHTPYFTFLTKKVIRISEKFINLKSENIFSLLTSKKLT